MNNSAAHLVDRVLPNAPIRQYVLSLPFELRRLAAFHADVLTALNRIFVEEIFASHRKRMAVAGSESGAVTCLQRFGSSLNLNLHFHILVIDGVFTRGTDGARFHEAPAPTYQDLFAIAERTKVRAHRWLERKGYLSQANYESNETPEPTALEACAQLALQRGQFADMKSAEGSANGSSIEKVKYESAAETQGFNVHAGVRIAADDDLGRERLCRYGTRPAFAADRIKRLPDGRIAYRTKALRGQRARCLLMTPLEFLARLAALTPPPRFPLLRFHGVLAPKSSWRKDVVPRLPTSLDGKHANRKDGGQASVPPIAKAENHEAGAKRSRGDGSLAFTMASATFVAPNILSVKHWERLENGALLAATPRLDWALLLRRCFSIDVLQCARCGERMRVLAMLTGPAASKILAHLKLPTRAPPTARARAPDFSYDRDAQLEIDY